MRKLLVCSAFLAVVCGLTLKIALAAQAVDEEKPKYAIKDVMHGAHLAPEGEKSLRDRVLAGNAKPEEKQELLDFYISLTENEPPKGELADWQKKTNAVVVSAAKVVVGREGAEKALEKATMCAACHKDHKPPAKE